MLQRASEAALMVPKKFVRGGTFPAASASCALRELT